MWRRLRVIVLARYLLFSFLAFCSAVALYFFFAFLLTIIPTNRKSIQPKYGIEIFIKSNTVHTDIIFLLRQSTLTGQKKFTPAILIQPIVFFNISLLAGEIKDSIFILLSGRI